MLCSGRLTTRKDPVPIVQEAGGLQGRSGWVRKISSPPGFVPRTVQTVVSRYTDYDVIIAKLICRQLLGQVSEQRATSEWNLPTTSLVTPTGICRSLIRSERCEDNIAEPNRDKEEAQLWLTERASERRNDRYGGNILHGSCPAVLISKWTTRLELFRNLVAHVDAREVKWRGNWRMECVASTLTPPPNVVIQHYSSWCAHLGCQQSTELTPPPIYMDSSGSGKDEIWFLLVYHHVPHELHYIEHNVDSL